MKIRKRIAKLQWLFFPPFNKITMEMGFRVFYVLGECSSDTEKFSYDLTFTDPSANKVFRAPKSIKTAL